MFLKFLDNLRTKPKAVRDQYSFLFALTLTLIVGGFWTLSLPERFSLAIPNNLAVATNTPPTTAPLGNFFTQFKNQFASVKEAIKNPPVATTTSVDATKMEITAENRQELNASTSEYVYKDPSQDEPAASPTILIGTSSATKTPAQ